MDFELDNEHKLMQREIRDLCEEYGNEYWREKDKKHEYPQEFFDEFAERGWCGLTIPEEYGGQGYGAFEAALIQQEIARSGAAATGASLLGHHVFSTAPLVRSGTEEHKEKYLPEIARGEVQICTGVTEPNAGTDSSRIETFAERDGDEYVVNGQKIWTSKAQEADRIFLLVRTAERDESDRFAGLTHVYTDFNADMDSVDVKEIPKAGRNAIDSNEVWFEDFKIPVEHRIGEEGEALEHLLAFANPERALIAAACIGTGMAAVEKASDYAKEREVFGSKIGSFQAIQHPLAESWAKLQQAELMVQKAMWLYDRDERCGAEANAAKLLASEAALEACRRAITTHGGMGYAKEYDVERYWREMIIQLFAPVSNEMTKNFIGNHVLKMPKSY
jgi:acyl-CoA dehydrogenase